MNSWNKSIALSTRSATASWAGFAGFKPQITDPQPKPSPFGSLAAAAAAPMIPNPFSSPFSGFAKPKPPDTNYQTPCQTPNQTPYPTPSQTPCPTSPEPEFSEPPFESQQDQQSIQPQHASVDQQTHCAPKIHRLSFSKTINLTSKSVGCFVATCFGDLLKHDNFFQKSEHAITHFQTEFLKTAKRLVENLDLGFESTNPEHLIPHVFVKTSFEDLQIKCQSLAQCDRDFAFLFIKAHQILIEEIVDTDEGLFAMLISLAEKLSNKQAVYALKLTSMFFGKRIPDDIFGNYPIGQIETMCLALHAFCSIDNEPGMVLECVVRDIGKRELIPYVSSFLGSSYGSSWIQPAWTEFECFDDAVYFAKKIAR